MATEAELAGIVIGVAALVVAIYAVRDSRKNALNLRKIPKISAHVEHNEALSDKIRGEHLASIRVDMILIHNSLDREIALANQDETDDHRIKRVFSYIKATEMVNKSIADRIGKNVEILRHHMEPQLLREIEGITIMIKYLSDDMVMFPDKLEAARSWLGTASRTVGGMKKLIDRLKVLIGENEPRL